MHSRHYHPPSLLLKTRDLAGGARKIRDPKDLSIKIRETKELLAFRYVNFILYIILFSS